MRGEYSQEQLAFIEKMCQTSTYTFERMAQLFNELYHTNWSRSKMGSLCYRRGWRVREAQVVKEKPVKSTWSPPGTISGRIEFKGPAQQLPKPLPNTSFRPDSPHLNKPLKLPGGVTLTPQRQSFKPTPPKVLITKPQPSRELNIVDLKYTGECKFPTTPNAATPSDHRFCGAPAELGKVYCGVHDSFCHVETKNLRRKA